MSESKTAYLVHPDGASAKDAMSQTDGAVQLLTRQQVAEMIGTSDAKIRRYAETDTTNEYFRGVTGLGKGVRYPAESVALFKDAMSLTPALFRERVTAAITASAGGKDGSNLPATRPNGAMSLSSLSAVSGAFDIERLIETIAVRVAEAPAVRVYTYGDKWLTLKEAREETGLTIAEIRSVPCLQSSPNTKRRWRRSDLQKLIETMQTKMD